MATLCNAVVGGWVCGDLIESGQEGIGIAFNILFMFHLRQSRPGSVRLRCGRGTVRAFPDFGLDSCSRERLSVFQWSLTDRHVSGLSC